jgi:hypothetical protein
VVGTGDRYDYPAFRNALFTTIANGELFMFCTVLLAPMFWIVLVDPPGAQVFPSKVSHMLLIAVVDVIAAVFFGLSVAGKRMNEGFSLRLSVLLSIVSIVLLYLGTVYHSSRLPNVPGEMKRQESDFSTAVREHRQ